MSDSPSPRALTIDLDVAERRIAELERQIADKVRERDGLAAVIALARNPRYADTCRWDAPKPEALCEAPPEGRRIRANTHREMVLTVLEEADGPLGVRGILDAITARFDVRLERTSISPLLRKLAGRGEVVHDAAGAKWSFGARADRTEGEIVEMRFGADEEEVGRPAA